MTDGDGDGDGDAAIEIDRMEDVIHLDLVDGRPLACILMDNLQDRDIDRAALEWNSENFVSIGVQFRISSVLDSALDMYRLFRFDDDRHINSSDRPLFDALRAELQGMIDRIDGLIFVSEEQGNETN